jgi:hypothetical protein
VDKVPPSTPIEETQKALNISAVSLPSHVRTAHDLLVALDRKEVEVSAVQAKKIRESIG